LSSVIKPGRPTRVSAGLAGQVIAEAQLTPVVGATYDKFMEALRAVNRPSRTVGLGDLTAVLAPRAVDPTRTSDVASHRKQQSGTEPNKRAGG
jgi:hypothetical protein